MRVKANEFKYEERDRNLKGQFINGINDNEMMSDKVKELTTSNKTNEVTSDHILS